MKNSTSSEATGGLLQALADFEPEIGRLKREYGVPRADVERLQTVRLRD
jgi:hypothetical protein